MTIPSFERIDYQLRYNKHIERKLIFDVLMQAKALIDFEDHQYLGFGSMWFADFRLAHRLLGLKKMTSMEHEEYADRARFNSPYRSVTVCAGNCSETLSAMNWTMPVVAWLDYDGGLTEDVSADLAATLQHCAVNSVVLVTVNAVRGSYRPRMPGPRTRADTALGQVERLLTTGVVPARFEPEVTGANHGDVSEGNFPEFLAESLLSYLSHVVASSGRQDDGGNRLAFLPIFNFCHRDGADMITIGGAVTAGEDARIWNEKIIDGIEYSGGLPIHRRLDLVPLTLKEKLVLDSCLPEGEVQQFLQRAKDCGVKLDDIDLAKYWHHHRHFPLFFEAPI